MTNQKRRDEASAKASAKASGMPEAGYRGSLPPQNDTLARPWVLVVIAAFVLIFALSFAGFPGSILPSPTPIPSVSASPSGSASESASGSGAASASASASASVNASPSVSPSPTQ